ncbi:MAG: serine--tRNA ligase [Pseudomonadota bacterium]
MHDIKMIRNDPDGFDKALAKRGLAPIAQQCLALDESYRDALTKMQDLQNLRNKTSKQIGLMRKNNEDNAEVVAEMQQVKSKIEMIEKRQKELAGALSKILEELPNVPADDVPFGKDEHDNIELRKWGTIPHFDFVVKRHFELGEQLGMMDFETAANLSGSRFVVLRKDLARLERALSNFMMDMHIEQHGYQEVIPPVLVRSQTVYATGQLPKFADDLFMTSDDRWLIPTAEVSLTAQMMGQTIDEDHLPHRYCAWTPCFRREAGAAGKDTRGMLRQHQFSKVEMVSITTPENSYQELERMTRCAETILEKLNLAYRTIILCTGDMGFGAAKTYDIEVWLPGENTYREISSCSNCVDFQARRMQARLKGKHRKGQYVHSLNGSGLAVGRTLIAVLENYQQSDGSIVIPDILKPYMGGMDRIQI